MSVRSRVSHTAGTEEHEGTGGATAGAAGSINGVQGLVQALHGLIEVQRSSGFTKRLKPPTNFAPENRSEELNRWMDWRFQFETFVGAVDPQMLTHMKSAEKEENAINDALPTIRPQSERLYSLLTGLMKQRPLRLVRGVANQNGLEAWRTLTRDLQPKTRQRSLALIQSLNKIQFDMNKTVTEQLPQFDLMVREYERSANATYPDDLKIASVIAALPSTLRLHIQMTLQDDTTFEDLRQKIEMYEQVSQRWMSDGGLQMNVKPLMDIEDRGGPMEVDAIWSKGGKKGGKKGKKGKDKGKSQKGKNPWSKDGGRKGGKGMKSSGKQDGKKGKGGVGNCHNCGKPGHFARECWSPKKINKVEEHEGQELNKGQQTTQAGRDPSQTTGASTGQTSHSTYRAGVRRVRLVTPTGLATMEIFDLTQDDSAEELETENEDEDLAMAILAVREVEIENEEETFYDCQSEIECEPPGTSTLGSTGDHDLRHDPRAQRSDKQEMKVRVCMVRQEAPTIALTLDSGADVSVAPEEYYAMGMPGTSRSVSMMDAQGGAIKSSGNRRLRLQAYTRDGELIEFVEQFALGVGVSHPLLSFGRLLKQGWVLSRDQDGLYVEHPERKMKIPARLERNSLVMDVRVCAVRADDMDDEPLTVENEAPKNDDVPKENAVASNDMTKPVEEVPENVERLATGSTEGAHHPDPAGGERGVKRAADTEDGGTLALMEELSEQMPPAAEDRPTDEAPTKKSKTAETEAEELRSPGYTTEESGDVVVEASSSDDGKVKARMARWANWKLRHGEVKSEPMELSDSPVVDVEGDENHVFPVRGDGHPRHGYISRELALLEKVPGWHALPNGIVVHSSPQATHFLDPSMSFGDEWCARLTLLKKKDNSGLWEQIESLAVYRDTPLPFRAIPGGPRPALTFVAPGLIRDYFVWNSEVPVSQYPLLQGEPSSWPDDERDEEGGEFPMLAAGSGGRAEIAEDVQFVDPDEMRVQIDDVWFDKETKLKDLQDICKQLGLATSGSKIKVLRRLQRYKHQEEEKLAYEVAQRLFSESRREAVPLKTPKLPSRHEQELHQLTRLPFQPWCQQCVATRSKEDPRTKVKVNERTEECQ